VEGEVLPGEFVHLGGRLATGDPYFGLEGVGAEGLEGSQIVVGVDAAEELGGVDDGVCFFWGLVGCIVVDVDVDVVVVVVVVVVVAVAVMMIWVTSLIANAIAVAITLATIFLESYGLMVLAIAAAGGEGRVGNVLAAADVAAASGAAAAASLR